MKKQLHAGVAEVDITPPVGTLMAGALSPRSSTGITDPLLVKVLVLQYDDLRMVYGIFDLAVLDRAMGERMTARAAAQSGIPADNMVWSCTHTHSGPCTVSTIFPDSGADPVDCSWLERVEQAFADAVCQAASRLTPVRVGRSRGYFRHLGHYRRFAFKDGRQINTWLIHRGEEDVQCVGAAGPLDPEVGIVSLEDDQGSPVAILFNVAIHANAHFGDTFSGDYPAVVAARLRERYGPHVVSLYMPGACGNINPCLSYREIGNTLADIIIERMAYRTMLSASEPLAVCRRNVRLPLRDPHVDQHARIRDSQWGDDASFFHDTQRMLRRRPDADVETALHAWRLGDVTFPGLPGEAFVEIGLRLKRDSASRWTYPVELCGDWLGYLVPADAYAAGGYESLTSTVGRVAPEGCETIMQNQLDMINGLLPCG